MKLFILFVLLVCAVVIAGLTHFSVLTWGRFTEEELEEMGVDLGRKKEL